MIRGRERDFLKGLFDAAVAEALPAKVVPRHLPQPPKGRLIVIGAGKASAAMAKAVEENYRGPVEGLVVTRYGHAVPCDAIEIVEAAHPVPDEKSVLAARRIRDIAEGAGPDDLVLALISGGGSALMCLPVPGLTLADKQAVNRALLASGAAIGEMNVVRKHLSAIKGGWLAAAAFPARLDALLISDVPGDDPGLIASGPTVLDPSTAAEAEDILRRRGIVLPPAVESYFRKGPEETPKPGDERLSKAEAVLIASPMASLEAAARLAEREGAKAVILGDAIEGEAREVGREMAAAALREKAANPSVPLVLLSGGETSVTVRGKGRGGRNAEFLAGLALGLNGAADIFALAADTDGIDGSEENAGAFVMPDTLARTRGLGLDAEALLDCNDCYSLFAPLGDLVTTGPTLTNVNDFRAILILPKG